MNKQRIRLWHPHQKLWNRELVRSVVRLPKIIARPILAVIVLLDSSLLLGRALLHLASPLGMTRGLGRKSVPILYIDCGTHKGGSEIVLVKRWFSRAPLRVLAFEASPRHFEEAQEKLAPLGVDIRQVAVVGPDYDSDVVRLYRGRSDGRGDSLFEARGEIYDEVPAVRMSAILVGEGFPLNNAAVIIRMNIEGAESFVIDDLADAGLIPSIDGFYGMWDDLSKIDPVRDEEFRRNLAKLGIHSFPFNERDLRYSFRRLAIRMDLIATIREAAIKKSL